MSGVLYTPIYFSGEHVCEFRAARIYDPSDFYYQVASGERHGIGLIKAGNDFLLPSCDYEKDVCCYLDGPIYFRDKECPNVGFDARGAVTMSSGLAGIYFETGREHSGSTFQIGHYFARTAKRTEKLKGRDYNSYDSLLHRDAGPSGWWDFDCYAHRLLYRDNPHGSLFRHDIQNVRPPTICSLFAVKNISIDGMLLRYAQDNPDDGVIRYEDAIMSYTYYQANHELIPNSYYVPGGYAGDAQFPLCGVRYLNAFVTINGEEYQLAMGNFDYYKYGSGRFTYVESPYWKVRRSDTSKAGKVYMLDEAITIHKNPLSTS